VERLQEKYQSEVVKAMTEKFGYKNVMQLPKLEKVIINMGVGESVQNPKALDAAVNDLTLISGQKPLLTRAKKSLAAWKLRQGMPIGCKVTLRGARMYQFLDKFMNIALPRVRDFRGVSKNAFDGRGNYAVGLKEQLIFPEIDYDKIDKIRGMNIVIVTTAKTDEEARELLRLLGMPFSEK
jgi:large subunit ribosomal protein L5